MGDLPTWVTVIIALVTALGGAGIGAWLLNVYNARNKAKLEAAKQEGDHTLADKKQSTELRLAENEQAFKIYKELLDRLRDDVSKMTQDMNKLEQEHLHCREENATVKTELRLQSKEIEHLKIQVGMKSSSVSAVPPLIEDKPKT